MPTGENPAGDMRSEAGGPAPVQPEVGETTPCGPAPALPAADTSEFTEKIRVGLTDAPTPRPGDRTIQVEAREAQGSQAQEEESSEGRVSRATKLEPGPVNAPDELVPIRDGAASVVPDGEVLGGEAVDGGFSSRILGGLQAAEEAGAPQFPAVRTVACMVTHGMGQQVPFETCALITEALVRAAGVEGAPQVSANRVQLQQDGELLARMELVFAAAGGQPETHVHVYEGYWAPLTEDQISFTRTVTYCLVAAWRGVRSALAHWKKGLEVRGGERKGHFFTRWVFGYVYAYPVKRHTLTMLLCVTVTLLLGLGLWGWCEQILEGALETLRHHHGFNLRGASVGQWLLRLWHLAVLAIGATYTYWLRYFFIEYMGDVVIYTASYQVSAYEEVRSAIQNRVVSLGKQLVAATVPSASGAPGGAEGRLLYDELVFVGHSLGSVITYDLVNALLVWDATGCEGRHRLLQRIGRLITFGSPLDKTAFLFRLQTKENHHYREALAGLMQPLIMSYAFRPFEWVNLYSHWDVVSGNLQYYDLPSDVDLPADARLVVNLRDPDARTPLLAHVQYWNGALLGMHLLAAVRGMPVAEAGRARAGEISGEREKIGV